MPSREKRSRRFGTLCNARNWTNETVNCSNSWWKNTDNHHHKSSFNTLRMCKWQSLFNTPPKFNSSPLKSYLPNRKGLSSNHYSFQRQAVKLWGCKSSKVIYLKPWRPLCEEQWSPPKLSLGLVDRWPAGTGSHQVLTEDCKLWYEGEICQVVPSLPSIIWSLTWSPHDELTSCFKKKKPSNTSSNGPFSIVKKRSILVYVKGFFWVKPQEPDISFSKSRLTGIHQQKSLHRNLQGSNFHRGSIYIYICTIWYVMFSKSSAAFCRLSYYISAFSCFHAAHLSILWWLQIPKYIRGFGGGDSGIRSHLDFWWFLWLWFRDQPNDIPKAWNIKSITECVKRLPNITKKLKGNGKHGLNQLVLPMHHNASITLTADFLQSPTIIFCFSFFNAEMLNPWSTKMHIKWMWHQCVTSNVTVEIPTARLSPDVGAVGVHSGLLHPGRKLPGDDKFHLGIESLWGCSSSIVYHSIIRLSHSLLLCFYGYHIHLRCKSAANTSKDVSTYGRSGFRSDRLGS